MDILNFGKSKLRRDLLNLYFLHTENKYYLRQLARLLNRPAAYIGREMSALEKSGLFISEFQGRERFFALNQKFPLFPEIKSIISKTIGLEKKMADCLAGMENIAVAFIFGSYARGGEDKLSDIDLILVGRPDEDKLIEAISRLESEISREINYHIFSYGDLVKKINKKDPFIRSVMRNSKIFLIGDERKLPKFNPAGSSERRKN